MKNKLKILITLTAICVSSNSFAAGASRLTGVKGTLKNIEKSVKAAISKAEELFEQNAGAALSDNMNLLHSPDSPFLSVLFIEASSYAVYIQFQGSSGTAFDYDSSGLTITPVAQVLMGAKIKMIPIYAEGDSVITSWECVTNADKNAKTFMGTSVESTVNNISFISTNGNNSENQYLANCLYLADSDITGTWAP